MNVRVDDAQKTCIIMVLCMVTNHTFTLCVIILKIKFASQQQKLELRFYFSQKRNPSIKYTIKQKLTTIYDTFCYTAFAVTSLTQFSMLSSQLTRCG